MRKIDEAVIRAIAPRLSANHREKARQSQTIEALAEHLEDQLEAFDLNTKNRRAYFLAQICHESAGFRTSEEYASGKAYEGRRDLGNIQPGDGVRFKGHGLIQVTGRANHAGFSEWCRERFSDSPDFVETPDALTAFPWALISAFWYWETRDLNAYADAGDFRGVTRKINGGYNGLPDRIEALARAEEALDPTPGNTLLRLGTRGPDVTALQTRLKQIGYRPGGIDGIFGHATEAAVRDFQAHSALTVDGKAQVGGQTWEALGEAVEGAPAHPVAAARASGKGGRLNASRVTGAADKATGTGVLVGAGTLGLTYWEDAQVLIGQYADIKTALIVVISCLAGYFWWQLQVARAARIDDHKRGKTL